jgi:hypothetical protein
VEIGAKRRVQQLQTYIGTTARGPNHLQINQRWGEGERMAAPDRVQRRHAIVGTTEMSSPTSGAGGKGLFGAGADMGIKGAGANGVLKLAGRDGLGMLHMRVGCGWDECHPVGYPPPPSSRRPPASPRLGLRHRDPLFNAFHMSSSLGFLDGAKASPTGGRAGAWPP